MRILKLLAASPLLTIVTIIVSALFAVVSATILFETKFFSAIAVYFVIWWLALFIVLPISIRSQAETAHTIPGTEPGAPVLPRICERAIMTTLLADVIFLGCFFLLPLAGL